MNGTTPHLATLAGMAERIAQHLATPEPSSADEPWTAQSLANGAAGISLLHIERALARHGTWQQAHSWITNSVTHEISGADTSGLYLGAPAIAFVLHAANAGNDRRYNHALKTVDRHVSALAHRRSSAAMARIHRGELASFHEYDIFYGLTGIGAYLLHSDPGGSALERILTYLVALTRPLRIDGRKLPGWWVGHDLYLRPSSHFTGGHSNQGAAHGITGPLLLLGQAMRRGVTVDGQRQAIEIICAWLDAWQQDSEGDPWWPEHITLPELHAGRTDQSVPARPSWCYGTPGIARAGQLAGIATSDNHRQRRFEHALYRCLTDPVQLAQVTDTGLCHGWAGIVQTTWRAARDAATPALRATLPHLLDALLRQAAPATANGPGFLEGDAGVALTLSTAAQNAAPISGWDTCLLIH